MLLRRLAAAAVSATLILSTAAPARAAAYDGSPKLVIELVFDQFRGDYLDRFRADFKAKNGWNLFLKQGAHYTDCYYDYANLVTGPGHSTIGTGAYTDGHGVPVNDWYEKQADGKLHYVQSIDDDRYTIVGQPPGAKVSPGASPHYEVASTLGDELVLATSGKARVFGVSLKDRAAILTSGHATKGAFWTDHESGRWITSTYWQKQLPAWVETFNSGDAVAKARATSKIPDGSFYEKVGATQAGVAYQLDFAKALIQNEHLGHNEAGVTDLITISVSSTDILGHRVGPDDAQQRALIDASDVELDRFFTWIDSTIGLKNVMVSMTGDHGVAPSVNAAVAMGMPARGVPTKPMWDYVEKALQAKFKPKGNVKYVLGGESPWMQIDPEPFQAQGISEQQAEDATADAVRDYFSSLAASTTAQAGAPDGRLPEPLRVQFVYTASQLRNGQVPDTDQGRRELHSYSPAIRWAVHMNFGAYQYYGSETGTTHYSSNSYDRHVPLDFFGAAFQPGTYHNQVEPVDIAATFASLLRVNRPSAAVGHVRLESLKPEVTAASGTVKRK
jgi:hypothetical protein